MIRDLWRQEVIKLLSLRFPYLLFALVLALQLTRMLASAFTVPETALDVLSAPELWAQGAAWGLRFSVYTLLVLGAMGFSREFSLGTAKTVLVLPIARWHWVMAKLGLLVALALAMLMASVLLSALVVAFTLGWQPVVREGLVIVSLGTIWTQLSLAVGLTGVFLLPVCAFALLVGFSFHSSGAAVGTAILAGLVLETLSGLFDLGRVIFLFHLYRPFDAIRKMGKGLPYQWDSIIAWGLPVCTVSFLILLGLLVWWMDRKDITG